MALHHRDLSRNPLTPRHRVTHPALVFALAALTLNLGGCNVFGWMAQSVHGDKAQQTTKTAQYRGLQGRTVAVLVSASPQTGYSHPHAADAVTQAVSARLVREIDAADVIHPRDLDEFRKRNPHWNTLPYSELARRLAVDRVVHIDLSRYQSREPGNAHQWQGVIVANIGVAEAESQDPASFAFATTLEVRYPESQRVGVVNANDATIQLGMVSRFSQRVVNLFKDHQIADAR